MTYHPDVPDRLRDLADRLDVQPALLLAIHRRIDGVGWNFDRLAADVVVSDTTPAPVGLRFVPQPGKQYEFEAILLLRTDLATVGPRPGLQWATGLADGVAWLSMPTSATAQSQIFGNISAPLLAAAGGLPNTTESFPSRIVGTAIAGDAVDGPIRIFLSSETAGTAVTIKAGSYLKYREI